MSPKLDRYRHVTFADALHPVGRAVDLGPWRPDPVAVDEPPVATLEEQAFLRWLFRLRRLHATYYRDETLQRRLPACLRALRAGSLQQARLILARSPELVDTAISALLIGVTSLFRDTPVFQWLAQRVLPELLAETGGKLRVWSIGCSDGAELYSIAMLLREMNALDQSELLGTDCRADAVARAALGRFLLEDMRNLPVETIDRHFVRHPQHMEIRQEIRQRLQWQVQDMVQTQPSQRWDLVLCRNVIMYMRPTVILRAWEHLEQALRPGGVLVVGKAERPIAVRPLQMIAPCIYRS
jgi:chemotaxis protein methyltransferase CheR